MIMAKILLGMILLFPVTVAITIIMILGTMVTTTTTLTIIETLKIYEVAVGVATKNNQLLLRNEEHGNGIRLV